MIGRRGGVHMLALAGILGGGLVLFLCRADLKFFVYFLPCVVFFITVFKKL